jgi:hypothetical protein
MYLTESKLIQYLKIIFPETNDWIRDKKIENTKYRFRPDYRSESLKLVIEFNGYNHYTNPKRIIDDFKKYDKIIELGYKVIVIPYFVQISSEMIKFYFNKDIKIKQNYPNGFIDKKATLPSFYCTLGVKRFIKELKSLPNKIRNDIIKSLKDHIDKVDDYNYIITDELLIFINLI